MAQRLFRLALTALCVTLPPALSGCGDQIPNQWVESGPATDMPLLSPSADEVLRQYEPAVLRVREWTPRVVTTANGRVTHLPLYTQDPFEDKGSRNGAYAIGWEDFFALAYCYPRFTANWLMIPVSAIVEPPWIVMESDGELSRQALGFDHDPQRLGAALRNTNGLPMDSQPDSERDADMDGDDGPNDGNGDHSTGGNQATPS